MPMALRSLFRTMPGTATAALAAALLGSTAGIGLRPWFGLSRD